MFKDGKYTADVKVVEVPKGASSRDFLFNNAEEKLINSNHTDQVVLIRGEKNKLVDLSFDEMKERLREKYPGKTIFPIIDNREEIFKPVGMVEFTWEYIVMIESGDKKRTFFLGDSPRLEATPQNAKIVRLGKVPVVSDEGIFAQLCFIVDDEKEKKEIENIIRYGNELRLQTKGMDAWVKKSGAEAKRLFVASSFTVVEETYDDLIQPLQQVFNINHMSVWKDLDSNMPIPSYVEASIIMAALFFYYEGFAAINLLVLGKPGCGKSFLLDTFAYLIGTHNHNCMETTLKGLVFSHAEKGGVYGVLYRERFVALLNEFMRIVSGARKEAGKDDVRRLLSTLNDAVEKKKNRSRSSGLVAGAEATMICSMITSDNYYPSVVDSFLQAMLDDPSYMRRYAFLKLSEETQNKGSNFTRVTDWRRSTDKWMSRRNLGEGKWYKILRFWRYQVRESMDAVDARPFIKYAKQLKEARLKKIFFQDGERQQFDRNSDLVDLYNMTGEADFSQLAVACACSAAIMGSTFRNDDLALPKVKMTVEDETLAYAMIARLVGDMMDLLVSAVQKKLSAGSGLRQRGGSAWQ